MSGIGNSFVEMEIGRLLRFLEHLESLGDTKYSPKKKLYLLKKELEETLIAAKGGWL